MKDTEGPLFAAALREKVLVDYEETSRNGTTLRPASWREREEGERQHVSDEGAAAEEFHSILFDRGAPANGADKRTAPAYFSDLNLDQILSSITAGYEEYDLGAFFYEHLDDPDTISYRQEVFGDLEREALFEPIALFVQQMRDMRAHLNQSNRTPLPVPEREPGSLTRSRFITKPSRPWLVISRPSNSNRRDSNVSGDISPTTLQSPAFTSLVADVAAA